jgi:pimeloyl-ACP methyl ester carboxylesterase
MKYLLLIVLISLQACVQMVSKNEFNESSKLFNCNVMGEGNPTIVFESGLGDQLISWKYLQDTLSKYTTTFTYDRLGLGKSASTKLPRTLENQAKDLHVVLQSNNIKGPIILVGHSLGGFIVRQYQILHPEQVIAMILIDPSNEYQFETMLNSLDKAVADSIVKSTNEMYKDFPKGINDEWLEFENSCHKMRNHPLPSNIPITILSSFQTNEILTSDLIEIKKSLVNNWIVGHQNVKIVSTDQSGHYIHFEEPDLVLKLIIEVLNSVKK